LKRIAPLGSSPNDILEILINLEMGFPERYALVHDDQVEERDGHEDDRKDVEELQNIVKSHFADLR
jgi:hypothetical protein